MGTEFNQIWLCITTGILYYFEPDDIVYVISCNYDDDGIKIPEYYVFIENIGHTLFHTFHAPLCFEYSTFETLCSIPMHQMENLNGRTQMITTPTRVTDQSYTLFGAISATMRELHTNTEVFRDDTQWPFSDLHV